MKKFILLCIYATFGNILYSQDADSLRLFLTEFQKVVFISSDSTYKFTRFIEPDGKFYFMEGFVDSIYSEGGTMIWSKKNKTGSYELKFRYVPGPIETINSYFPIKGKEHPTTDIIDEVRGSYILKQLGEPKIINSTDKIVRVLYPTEDLNLCKYYRVFKIRFFTDYAKLYSFSGRSVDYKGIQLIRIDSCMLKKKDIGHFKKQLSIVSAVSDTTCRRPGNPWILEYNDSVEYKHFIISDYCSRGKKNFKPIRGFRDLIIGTYIKYYNVNSLVYP